MKESAVDRIKKQYSVLASSSVDFLIRDCIDPSVNRKQITVKNDVNCPRGERSLKAQKYFNYCKQYISFYKSRSYQFLFCDYSLGRFNYEFDDNDHLVSYSLYWNPCPISLEYRKEMEDCNLDFSDYIDNTDDKETIELNNIVLRTPIRLDYVANYDGTNPEYHPSFHMHFQDKNTRVKTDNILSLYSYILFVLENCYPDLYTSKDYQDQINRIKALDKEARQGFSIYPEKRNTNHGIKIISSFKVNY